ncbi:AAA family ATPase [Streptomyces sp. NPDC005917]|uniref:AAA family ATPase n=1 Tax=unclassified Streptomyces TaxID=2593676 RepID=UPI0033EFCCA9
MSAADDFLNGPADGAGQIVNTDIWLVHDEYELEAVTNADPGRAVAVIPGDWETNGFVESLRGREVGIFQHRDEGSRTRARALEATLTEAGITAHVLHAYGAMALTTHIESGHPLEISEDPYSISVAPTAEEEARFRAALEAGVNSGKAEKTAPAVPDTTPPVAETEARKEFDALLVRYQAEISDMPDVKGSMYALARQALNAALARRWADGQARRILAAHEAAQTAPDLPQVVSLTDLLARPENDAHERVAGLQPTGGKIVLAAARKAGKTTFVGNLVRSLADAGEEPFDPALGNGFLGCHAVADVPGTIVVIDNEMSEDQLQRWYRDLGIKRIDRVSLWPLRGQAASFNIMDPACRAWWVSQLRDLPGGVSYLVLDCLGPFLGALGMSESPEDVNVFLQAVNALIREADVPNTALAVHMGHGPERPRGASQLRDWPDAEWRITYDRDSRDREIEEGPRFFSAYGRDVHVPESRLEFSAETRTLTLVGGSRALHRVTAGRDPVRDFIKSNPGLGVNKILAGLPEVPDNKIRKALEDLVSSGEVHTAHGPNRMIRHFVCDPPCGRPADCSKAGDSSDSG